MSTWEYQFQQFLELLSSPAGLFMLVGGLTLMILALIRPWARIIVLMLLLWSTTLTLAPESKLFFDNTLISPLQQLRENGRAFTLACLLTLFLPAVLAPKLNRLQLIATPLILFFCFQLVFSTMDMLLGERLRGVLGLGMVMLGFIVLGRGVGGWIHSFHDAHRILYAVAGAAVLFVAATAAQGIINADAIKWNGRLYATTSNPQHAATAIATFLPVVAYLIVRKGTPRLGRIMLAVTLGLLVVFLLWTKSRTGALMSIVGLTLLFRFRLGKLLFAAAAAAVAVLVGLHFFGEGVEGADRLVSLQDTRTGAWRSMWSVFSASPLTGTIEHNFFGSENSYLWTAARYGLIGLLPLAVAMFFFLRECVLLHAARRHLDAQHSLLADLVVAIIAAAGAGAFFEGFLLGQFHLVVYTLFIVLAIGRYLLDVAQSPYLAALDEVDMNAQPVPEPQLLWSHKPTLVRQG